MLIKTIFTNYDFDGDYIIDINSETMNMNNKNYVAYYRSKEKEIDSVLFKNKKSKINIFRILKKDKNDKYQLLFYGKFPKIEYGNVHKLYKNKNSHLKYDFYDEQIYLNVTLDHNCDEYYNMLILSPHKLCSIVPNRYKFLKKYKKKLVCKNDIAKYMYSENDKYGLKNRTTIVRKCSSFNKYNTLYSPITGRMTYLKSGNIRKLCFDKYSQDNPNITIPYRGNVDKIEYSPKNKNLVIKITDDYFISDHLPERDYASLIQGHENYYTGIGVGKSDTLTDKDFYTSRLNSKVEYVIEIVGDIELTKYGRDIIDGKINYVNNGMVFCKNFDTLQLNLILIGNVLETKNNINLCIKNKIPILFDTNEVVGLIN